MATNAAPLDTAGLVEVRCDGCGSAWTDADLARERAANPGLLSCCPERKPPTIDQWKDRAERAEAALAKPASEPAGGGVRDGLAAELLTAYHAIDAAWPASTGQQRLAKHDALAAIHEASRALSSPASSSPGEEAQS